MVRKAVKVRFYRFFLIFILYNSTIFVNALKTDPMCSEVEIVSKSEWKARPEVRNRHIRLPLNHIIIFHTVTAGCKTKFQCIRKVKSMQDMHLDERGWWDIGYNFLIGGDGRVYEGRGWNFIGTHSANFNSKSLGVAFIGNFNEDIPTKAMVDAAQHLIECGVRKGYLTPTHEVHGHKDVSCTESPGDNLYAEIRRWKNYKGGRLEPYNCSPLEDPVMSGDIIKD